MDGDKDDVFEVSDYNLDGNDDAEKSSASSSKEDPEAAWERLPNGAKEIFTQAKGILYMERYESFIRNNWPYDVKKGNLCHPRALALAGLTYHSLEPAPSAECIVCLKILKNLQQQSNPWILHSEISPECYFVKLGQRDQVDDYSMDEVMEMAILQISNVFGRKLDEKERNLKKRLHALRQHELALGAQ